MFEQGKLIIILGSNPNLIQTVASSGQLVGNLVSMKF